MLKIIKDTLEFIFYLCLVAVFLWIITMLSGCTRLSEAEKVEDEKIRGEYKIYEIDGLGRRSMVCRSADVTSDEDGDSSETRFHCYSDGNDYIYKNAQLEIVKK